MADLQNILNKLTELGIENKGLTPDDPTQAGAIQKQYGNEQSVSETDHRSEEHTSELQSR